MTDADPCQRKSKAGDKCGILFNRCGTGYTCSGSICKPTIIDVDDIMKLINDGNIIQLTELLEGIKPLEQARIREGRPAIINDTDCKGFTPLMRAALLSDNWVIIKLLIDSGADRKKQHKTYNNFTALMFAIVKENISNISELVYYDPGIDLQATDGVTALMLALSSKKILYLVDLLLKRGADPTIKNNMGQTARDLVSSMDIADKATIIELLEQYEKKKEHHWVCIVRRLK